MAVSAMERRATRPQATAGIEFSVYAPATPGLPFLAVVLSGCKLIQAFASTDRLEAERIVDRLKARLHGHQLR